MIRSDDFLEPLKYYENGLKDLLEENVEALFDELTKNSKVDVEENKTTCEKYYKEESALNKVKSRLARLKVGIVFTWIFIISSIIVSILMFVLLANSTNNKGLYIGVGIGCIVLAIGLFLLYFLYLRKKKKLLTSEKDKLEEICRKLRDEAWAQMAPLNALFDERMSSQLFTKSAPIIEMDEHLMHSVEQRIVNQFNCPLDRSSAHSSLVVQSGSINTNPFILRQALTMKMKPYTYTGSIVITYTRTVSDGKGGYTTETVSQTLTAHVTRPKPYYSVDTSLTYYTDVGGKLSFMRAPAGLVGKTPKQMEKIANKKDKEQTKKAARALKEGAAYTKITNSKFEAYINAEGRDNELEYRFLFTPLAQENYCYNFSKQDDIYYTKLKCANIIRSKHDYDMDYSGSPTNYYSFDYEVIKKKFHDYNMKYFEGIYFDFLPLISIPAFHENRSEPYIAPRGEKDLLGMYEREVMVNRFEPSLFKPADCDTDIILKVNAVGEDTTVTAYGYHADPRTDLVPVMGGDGHLHNVPVHYFEYLPVEESKLVKVFNNDSKSLVKNEANVINYKKYKVEYIG